MNWPAVFQTKTRRVFALFALAELSLVIAIPFLAVAGVHAVLESRSGAFVQQVGPTEPGWLALVEPNSVVVVVEQYRGQTTGVTLIVHEQGVPGGAIVLMPGNVVVSGKELADLALSEVVPMLSEAFKLRIDESVLVDETIWPEILGEQSYVIPNAEVISVDSGGSFPVGDVVIDGSNAGDFIGSRGPAAGLSTLLARRELFWSAMVESPSGSGHLIAIKSEALTQGNVDIFDFPKEQDQNKLVLDEQNAAELVARAVPFPAGAQPHHRIRLRVLDRTGQADLPAIALELAAGGFEVVEMGNAPAFDNGSSELVVPSQWIGPDPSTVAEFADVDSVVEQVDEPESVATLLIGDDFSLISA